MKYGFEWTPGLVLVAMVLILPLAPPFALIGVVVVALAVLAALVALAVAVLASPYLLVRALHRHLVERRERAEASGPVADLAVHSI
jgi:Zn-dependent membrane protease YugP